MNYVELAKEALSECKLADATRRATTETTKTTESPEAVLKGRAIELWSDGLGERFWLVADEADAARLGEPRGSVYAAAEARRVIQIGDAATMSEVNRWKRKFEGVVGDVMAGDGR